MQVPPGPPCNWPRSRPETKHPSTLVHGCFLRRPLASTTQWLLVPTWDPPPLNTLQARPQSPETRLQESPLCQLLVHLGHLGKWSCPSESCWLIWNNLGQNKPRAVQGSGSSLQPRKEAAEQCWAPCEARTRRTQTLLSILADILLEGGPDSCVTSHSLSGSLSLCLPLGTGGGNHRSCLSPAFFGSRCQEQ